MGQITQTIDWPSFWQEILPSVTGLIIGILVFITGVIGLALIILRANARQGIIREKHFMEMVQNQGQELQQVREDARDDRNRMDVMREQHDQSMKDLRSDYEKRFQALSDKSDAEIARLRKQVEGLIARLSERETELEKERNAKRQADAALQESEAKREKMQQEIDELKEQLAGMEKKIQALETSSHPVTVKVETPSEPIAIKEKAS